MSASPARDRWTAPSRLGTLTLRPEQRACAHRVVAAIAEFGGALLADAPGTGKTVVALAVAADAPEPPTLVVAPAVLRDHWHRLAKRADVRIAFTTFEALSRGATPAHAAFMIVDEAHHARTPTTARYRALADLCRAARVLLLTATPVVNGARDRDALLALFLGSQAATLGADRLARCIIRQQVRQAASAGRPPMRRLPTLAGAGGVNGVADALRTLPPPFPASDGLDATALVRLTLAMAWRSSLAALDAALRRRLQRGGALREALMAGHWPDRRTLRQWIVGDDATQLPLPGFFVSADVPTTVAVPTLDRHLDAVRHLREMIRPCVEVDTATRADALRTLAARHPARRIAVLARHADTVHALHRALRTEPGVIAVTGARVRAAAGRWSRAEVLEALGPRARPLRADDPRAIRILLATDLLAEGIELQGVSILVHADRTWTPARHEQREGRIARIGALEPTVLVTAFRAPRGASELLGLGARLETKHRARRDAVRDAERLAALAARLERVTAMPLALVTTDVSIRVVAELSLGAHRHHVAGIRRDGRWRFSRAPHALLRAAAGRPVHMTPACRAAVRAALVRWLRRECTMAWLMPARERTADAPPTGRDAFATPLRLARRRIAEHVVRLPLANRGTAATDLEAVLARIAATRNAGTERQLIRLLRDTRTPGAFAAAIRRVDAERHGVTGPGDAASTRLVRLYAFSAARTIPRQARPHVRPSASPGSAGPR